MPADSIRPDDSGTDGLVGATTNSPDLSTGLKMRVRAIKGEEQLAEIVKRLQEENRERNIKNARIMGRYNAERPHAQRVLEAEGLGWKANFSTQPLSSLVDRVAPRFARALDAVRYLTSAELPDYVPNAAMKTEFFRKEFTDLVRAHPDWKDFVAQVSQEDSLFGYTCGAFPSEFSFFPQHFRQDEFMVPASTSQNSGKASLVVLKETFLPHELFELISDKEAAKDVGWDIKNTVDAINKAMPENITKNFSDDARRYEDLQREANLYASMANGAKVVIAWHCFVVEVTGKVSHYLIDGNSWKMLFEREDQYENMRQACHFFSFQQANGKLQASKGVGRTLYALAGIVDRARNEVVDRLQLSGKILVQGEEKKIRQFKMSVIGQAIVISKDFTLTQNRIDAGVEPFLTLDGWVLRLMDELAGNVSPAAAEGQMKGERVTNGQINYLADLNAETKDIKIERFLMQAGSLLSEMQRRAVDPQVDDDGAQEFQQKCLETMSKEELEAIAKHPAAATVVDFTDQDRQLEAAICTEVMNDPLINRREAMFRKLASVKDAEFAAALMLPDEDPTIIAEQTRTQILENQAIEAGQGGNFEPSPRDNHQIHLSTLLKRAEEVAALVAEDPSNAELLAGYVDHGMKHLQLAASQGADEGSLKPFADALAAMQAGIQQVAQAAQQQLDMQQGAVNAPPQV